MSQTASQFVAASIAWEAELVHRRHQYHEIASGTSPLHPQPSPIVCASASNVAAECSAGIRECLQARAIVRRLADRAPERVVLELCRAGFLDYAAAFVSGDWDEDGPIDREDAAG